MFDIQKIQWKLVFFSVSDYCSKRNQNFTKLETRQRSTFIGYLRRKKYLYKFMYLFNVPITLLFS